MERIETTKAVISPVASTASSVALIAKPSSATYFTHFNSPQPNITGIARKNVNSAAAVLEQPHSMPPMMVDPDRDVPGIIAST